MLCYWYPPPSVPSAHRAEALAGYSDQDSAFLRCCTGLIILLEHTHLGLFDRCYVFCVLDFVLQLVQQIDNTTTATATVATTTHQHTYNTETTTVKHNCC